MSHSIGKTEGLHEAKRRTTMYEYFGYSGDQATKLEIKAFVSFRPELAAGAADHAMSDLVNENGRLIPTDSDLLLSALEPFRDCPIAKVRVYDLGTSGGRLRGMLSGVSEIPAIIVNGERHLGLADSRAVLHDLSRRAIQQTIAAGRTRP